MNEAEVTPRFYEDMNPRDLAADILETEGYGMCDYVIELHTGEWVSCDSPYVTSSTYDHCAEEGRCWTHCTDKPMHDPSYWEDDSYDDYEDPSVDAEPEFDHSVKY